MIKIESETIRSGEEGGWNFSTKEYMELSNLGTNLFHLDRLVDKCGNDNVFVELGVDCGVSSLLFSIDAIERNNKTFGVDTQFNRVSYDIPHHPNWQGFLWDSSTLGKYWNTPHNQNYSEVDLLFVDTIHVAPQVLCELYHWYPHVKEGGHIVFHDTAWPKDMHDLTWVPEVREKGIKWDRPEVGVGQFFGIESVMRENCHKRFTYEDENISVEHHPESWGMTIVHLKKKIDFGQNLNWNDVFEDRNTVVGYFNPTPGAVILNDIREELDVRSE
jgi:hypothetical protein